MSYTEQIKQDMYIAMKSVIRLKQISLEHYWHHLNKSKLKNKAA